MRAMSTLEALTVDVSRSFNTESTSVNGVVVSQKKTTALKMTLMNEASLRASFKKEGVVEKVVKLFKKELQTGDVEFDKKVYISTDTPDVTARFLEDENVRLLILALVQWGGVEVDGKVVQASVEGHTDDAPRELVQFLQYVVR